MNKPSKYQSSKRFFELIQDHSALYDDQLAAFISMARAFGADPNQVRFTLQNAVRSAQLRGTFACLLEDGK